MDKSAAPIPPAGDVPEEKGWPRWSPDFLLDEQPRPPPTDVRVEEELAAQAVAVAAGYEPRRVRKFLQRRTVDYSCTYMQSAIERLQRPSTRHDHYLRPSAHFTNSLLAPVYYDSAASSITSTLVHTSTNKVRCPVNVVRVRVRSPLSSPACRAPVEQASMLTRLSGRPRAVGCSPARSRASSRCGMG